MKPCNILTKLRVKLTWADVLFDDEKEVVIAKKEASVGDSEHHDSRVNLRDIF